MRNAKFRAPSHPDWNLPGYISLIALVGSLIVGSAGILAFNDPNLPRWILTTFWAATVVPVLLIFIWCGTRLKQALDGLRTRISQHDNILEAYESVSVRVALIEEQNQHLAEQLIGHLLTLDPERLKICPLKSSIVRDSLTLVTVDIDHQAGIEAGDYLLVMDLDEASIAGVLEVRGDYTPTGYALCNVKNMDPLVLGHFRKRALNRQELKTRLVGVFLRGQH